MIFKQFLKEFTKKSTNNIQKYYRKIKQDISIPFKQKLTFQLKSKHFKHINHFKHSLKDFKQGSQTQKYVKKQKFIFSNMGMPYSMVKKDIFPLNDDSFKISMRYQNTDFNNKIIEKCLETNFFPNFYLKYPLLQSFYNVVTPEAYQINFNREYVPLPDGGQISLDWTYPKEPLENKILFIIHGLTGGSEMPYVQSLVGESINTGFTTVVFHNRGINGTALTTPEPFSGVKLDDIENTIKYIQNKYEKAELYGVGLSLGGNLILRYAGTKKKNVEFKGIVAIATPFDIGRCLEDLLPTYETFFIERYMNQTLVPNIEILMSLEKTHDINFEQVTNSQRLKEFHEKFTVKVFGFKNADDYFDAAKITSEHTQNIKIPTLLIHSKDDPITTIKSVPVKQLMKNKNIIYFVTKMGSHVCWLNQQSKPERVNFYFISIIFNYFF